MLELKNIKKIIEVINLASSFKHIEIEESGNYKKLIQRLDICSISDFKECENYLYFEICTECLYEGVYIEQIKILKSDFQDIYKNFEYYQKELKIFLESIKTLQQKQLELLLEKERLEKLKIRQDFINSDKCSKMMEITEKLNFSYGQDDIKNFWIKNLNDEYIYLYPQFRPSVDKISVVIIKKFIK